MKTTFFIDFDNTITNKDTCDLMVKTFAKGDWKSLNTKWQKGKLSTVECARETFKLFDTNKGELEKLLLEEIKLDSYFSYFLKICKENDFKIYIVSDGYDFNIKTILSKYNIDNIPFFSNKLIIDNTSFDIKSIYGSKVCTDCGTCKTNIIKKLRPKKKSTVYIGDGYSDMCAAKKADIIFAKDDLLKYCIKNNINAIPFNDFSDIISWINNNLEKL